MFTEELAVAVADRYETLARQAENLSCGSALERARVCPGEVVVDLGCGRGGSAYQAALAVGESGQVVGIDANEAMIAVARENGQGIHWLTFQLAAFWATGLPSAIADVVLSNCAINHAPAKEAVYREIYRLLKTGGRFVVSDIIADTALPPSVRDDPAAWAACYGGALTLAENEAAILAAGFERVEILELSEPYLKEGIVLRKVTFCSIKVESGVPEKGKETFDEVTDQRDCKKSDRLLPGREANCSTVLCQKFADHFRLPRLIFLQAGPASGPAGVWRDG